MEKSKRWRPSLGLYRQLKAELESQMDATSVLVADCDAWREKYRDLVDSVKKGDCNKVLRDHICALESENSTLGKSNKLIEEEIKRLREADVIKEDAIRRMTKEMIFLKSRGLWDRIINKGV